jgi:hypothetical protein
MEEKKSVQALGTPPRRGWAKIDDEMISDPKIRSLTGRQFRLWVHMLINSWRPNGRDKSRMVPGQVYRSVQEMAGFIGTPVTNVHHDLREMESLGIISRVNGVIVLATTSDRIDGSEGVIESITGGDRIDHSKVPGGFSWQGLPDTVRL